MILKRRRAKAKWLWLWLEVVVGKKEGTLGFVRKVVLVAAGSALSNAIAIGFSGEGAKLRRCRIMLL